MTDQLATQAQLATRAQLATSDIGYFIQSCLGVCSEEGIEKISDNDETPNIMTENYISEHIDMENPSSMLIHLSNGQRFRVTIDPA